MGKELQGSDGTAIPRHVGIIMDGNGRWAQARGMPRSYGHQQGLKTAKRMVGAVSDAGIENLSLFVFSTENWKRAREEVSFLMELLVRNLARESKFYLEKGIHIVHSGDPDGLTPKVRQEIERVCEETRAYSGMTLNLAINYGGKDEILRGTVRLFRKLLAENPDRESLEKSLGALGEEDLGSSLDVPGLPPLDLLIRTGGERRVSNFLLWQSAYAELHFSDRLWPDWDESDLQTALSDFAGRQRRFGGVISKDGDLALSR